jgi:acyl-CoA synthetase (AMP-forming)/AMP-acid ligase II
VTRVEGFAVARPDEPFVAGPAGVVTRAALLAGADDLVARLKGGTVSAAIDGGNAAEIVSGLIAAERLGCRLILSSNGSSVLSIPPFEIVLETSGTTGRPRRRRHSLDALAGHISTTVRPATWFSGYATTSFAGLQVILTAFLSGGRLVRGDSSSLAHIRAAARATHATHGSATPTFWRHWLLSEDGESAAAPLEQITIGGEPVDQHTLDRLRITYPSARITHIYASTEAGVCFSVRDGKAGFPAAWLAEGTGDVRLRIRDAELDIESPRRSLEPVANSDPSAGSDGCWISTDDLVEVVGDRVMFRGRRNNVINVGGAKVHAEKVERVLLEVAGVVDAHVYGRSNGVTGQLVAAAILCGRESPVTETITSAQCHARRVLARHEVPVVIEAVDHIDVGPTGKKTRG